MKKIISLFQRNSDGNRLVYDEVVEGAEWVLAAEGIATRKWDGTACMFKDKIFYKRLHIKEGNDFPKGWLHWDFDIDVKNGHGWALIKDGPEDKFHREGLDNEGVLDDGTYELIGPRIQKNPEGVDAYFLKKHGDIEYPECPITYSEIKEWFKDKNIEGIVWHHEDGRMVKIKKKDFGLKRKEIK